MKYGSYEAKVERKIELISITVSDQKWNSAGDTLFTATISECSFNLVTDINWYISEYIFFCLYFYTTSPQCILKSHLAHAHLLC